MKSAVLAVIAASVGFAQAGFAQVPLSQSEIRGKQVIDAAIAALGGSKFLKMEDRVESGRAYSFYREQLSGLSIAKIYTRYLNSVPPDRTGEDLAVRERQGFGKNEEYGYVLFREEGGWEVTFRGPRELAKDRLERYRDTTLRNIFYILRVRLHEPGMIFEYKGSDVVENLPVDIVDIADAQNRVVTAYFDPTTKLPVRQFIDWRDPDTRERNEEITRFARYREVNGIQWPHQITRERNGEKVYQIFAESVTFNNDLTDDLFAVPTGPATRVKRK